MAGLAAGLAGLSAAYPGYVKGRVSEDQADEEDLKLSGAKRDALAKIAMGRALAMLSGGQGAQAPQPGQPSQPMMPPGAPPQGGMPQGGPPPQMQPQPMQRPPQAMPGGPPGMPPGGQPQMGGPPQMGGMQQQRPGQGALDWRQLVAAVKQANPNLPPDVMAEAVNQFLPLMNQQSQMEWKQLSLQLREQSLNERMQQFQLAESGRNQRADTADTGRNQRTEQLEGGRNQRAAANREQKDKQFNQREARLEQSLKLREDSTWARLEQQKQQAQQRVDAAQGKQGLAQLRAIIDAQDKHVRTRIQAYSANNTMKPEERKALLDQADKEYNEQLDQLRQKYGRSTPGATPKKEGQGKAEARVPQSTGNPGVPPPEALKQLKEGHVTTFQNGQKWTLKNGQPEQVQ